MTARDEAIEAVARSMARTFDVDFDALEGAWESEYRLAGADALDAAIPHLLAPIRAFAEELKAADDGSLVTSDYAWIGRRLNALLDQIEAESKR